MEDDNYRRPLGPRDYCAIVAVSLVALPLLLIAVGILEEVTLGSHRVARIYRDLGIFEPLDWIVDNTFGRFVD